MAPRAIFQTTVLDPETGIDATFLVVPRGSFATPNASAEAIAGAVGVERLTPITEALDIFPALALVLAGDAQTVAKLGELSSEDWLPMISTVAPSAKRGFASYCATAEILPVEASPLKMSSLVSMIAKGTSMSAGASIGFIISGPTLLALVLVPAGMVIFGAAAGVAKGLEGGLEHKIRQLLGAPDKPNGGAPGAPATG